MQIALILHSGDSHPYWTTLDRWTQNETIIDRDESNASLEDLVVLCDRAAEGANAHDLCGIHRLLGAVLNQQQGRVGATLTMLVITKLGGLHAMGGICSENDAYELLAVGESGRDWSGRYPG